VSAFRRMACLALACAMLTLMGKTASAEDASGRYGPLLLAVRDREVRGLFSEGRIGNGDEDAPQFSCIFFLEGALENARADVETWFPVEPARIPGKLDLGPEPSLELAENHGGCLMTSGDMATEPYRLPEDERHPEWIGVGLVTAPRAVLRREATDDPDRTRPYLVAFDAFAVLEQRVGWVRVAFRKADGAAATGWLRADETSTRVVGQP
jgi:hypothetical protein